MATHLTWRTSEERRGLRPFHLRRDLVGVVDLVLLAFADEPERVGGQSTQEDLRLLKRLAPFVWLSCLFSTQAREFFTGFVWEEEGRVVGNVSVSKIGRESSRWLIGNVATHPDYRRRGIARSLTVAAIDLARSEHGQYVVLDVRADNKPAYDLYRSLGFRHVGGTTALKLTGWNGDAAGGWPKDGASAPLNFQSLNRWQWQPAYEMARAAMPAAAQAFSPVRPRDYQTGFVRHTLIGLSQALTRRKDYRLLALDGKRPAACLEISVRGIKLSHRLRTIIHPDYRGKVEGGLVSKAMEILRYHPWNSVWAEIPCDQTEQIAALKKSGFRETVTQHRLGLRA